MRRIAKHGGYRPAYARIRLRRLTAEPLVFKSFTCLPDLSTLKNQPNPKKRVRVSTWNKEQLNGSTMPRDSDLYRAKTAKMFSSTSVPSKTADLRACRKGSKCLLTSPRAPRGGRPKTCRCFNVKMRRGHFAALLSVTSTRINACLVRGRHASKVETTSSAKRHVSYSFALIYGL